MKHINAYPAIFRALQFGLALLLTLWFLSPRLSAQCQGFFITVDTDPPYLTYCPGDTVLAFPIITGGTGPFSYSWSTGGTDSIEVLLALETGWYTACVTVTDANGCVAVGCKHIKPTYWNLYIFENGPQCIGETVQLSVSVGPPNTFLWSTGETTNPINVTAPGIYTVTVTDPVNGCVQEMEVEAEFFPLPIPEIAGPAQICDGQTAELEVVDPFLYLNYMWSTGEVTPTIEITGSGTYVVTVTDVNWCTGTAEFVVEHLLGTLPELNAPPYLCPEDEGIIEVTNAGELLSFLWSTGETTSSITGMAPETFFVTVTDLNGCIESGEVSIALFEITDPVITGDADICFEQETVTITVDPPFEEYLWSTGESTQSITVSDPDVYLVTVTDVNGCTTTGEHEIVAAPIPDPYIQIPPPSCDSLPVLLEVFGAGGPYVSFLWSPTGETTGQIVIFESGTFSVWVENEFGCTGETFEETVMIGNGPEAGISVTPLNCNESVILTASGEGYYTWSTGATTETITVTGSGTYALTVTDDNGCTDATEVTVSVSGVLEVEMTGPPAICEGDTATLGVTASYDTYLWSGGETSAEISVIEPGTYSVTVSDASGCTGVDSLTISSAPSPEPEITGPGGFCIGDSVTLMLNEVYHTMVWSNGATTQAITISEPDTYSVVVTNAAGCTASAEWALGTFPEASVEIIGPGSVCTGGSAVLALSGNYSSVVWSTGETSPEIEIAGSGTFWVEVTDSNGCTATDLHLVDTADSLDPVIMVSGPPCSDTIVLDAGAGYDHYLWSSLDTTPVILVTVPGSYSVTVSDDSGCSGESVTDVSVVEPPQVSISGPGGICAGEVATLSASPGFVSYSWSNGATTDLITVSESGTYTVIVTDANGCTATAGMSFETFPLPVVNILGPASMCTGSSAVLTVPGVFEDIIWSTGETTPAITVSGNGTYQVMVTDSNGCTASDVHTVETADSLSPAITVVGPLCDGFATLDAGTGYDTYVWSTGATTPTVTVTVSGSYSVTVSDQSGCSGQDHIDIAIPEPPEVSITGPTTACAGEPGTLTASPGFESYTWSTGENTESILVNVTGDFSVIVTDSNGCTAMASQSFEVFPLPVAEIAGPEFLCDGDMVSLSISGSFTQILWSTGATTDSISVTQGGLYSVLVTDMNGCTATSALQITQGQTDHTFVQTETCSVQDTGTVEYVFVNQFGCDSVVTVSTFLTPSLSTSVSFSACMNGSAVFEGIEIEAGTSRQFVYTAANGCDSIVTVTVELLPPVEYEVHMTPTCTNETYGSIEVLVHHGGAACLFALDGSAPQANPVFSNLSAGVYNLQVFDSNGCSYHETVEVPETAGAEVVVEDQELGCDKPTVILEPVILEGNAGDITWYWSNGSSEPWIEVDKPGNYFVLVDDGCTERKFNISVDWAEELRKEEYFYVPNAFSPNDDGVNEIFQVFPGPDLVIRSFEFRIFDRWGSQLFSTNTTEDGWNGIFRGEKMQPGVYVWFIRAHIDVCGIRAVNVLHKGDVTVVR